LEKHSIFERDGNNLYCNVPISFAEATLGAEIEIPTLSNNKVSIDIPPGTQTGKYFRLRGKGMPLMRNRNYGDLYIRAITEVPVSLTKEQKKLLEEFKKLEDTKTNPIMKDFFEKAKRFWEN
jgi:molecular chaperone DnaJ